MFFSHLYTLKDGSELPKVPRRHAEEGGEVLEGMYSNGCMSMEESKISGQSGRARGHVSAAVVGSGPAGIVSKDPRIMPT
jgi:hypothetical protein